jgi:hypothetical protein
MGSRQLPSCYAFSDTYGTRSFITALTPILSQTNPVHTTQSHPMSIYITSHLNLGLPSFHFPYEALPNNLDGLFSSWHSFPHSRYIPCPSSFTSSS